MATFRYVVCDVFTDTPLTGNQLAVFTDARELDTHTMQLLAREMNFADVPCGPRARTRSSRGVGEACPAQAL